MSLDNVLDNGQGVVAIASLCLYKYQLVTQISRHIFFLFDLLWTDGHDFTGKAVVQRHAGLERIITPVSRIQVGGYVEVAGMRGLEWIIAKSNWGR